MSTREKALKGTEYSEKVREEVEKRLASSPSGQRSFEMDIRRGKLARIVVYRYN